MKSQNKNRFRKNSRSFRGPSDYSTGSHGVPDQMSGTENFEDLIKMSELQQNAKLREKTSSIRTC